LLRSSFWDKLIDRTYAADMQQEEINVYIFQQLQEDFLHWQPRAGMQLCRTHFVMGNARFMVYM